MIPVSVRFDQSTMASLLEVDPLVREYRAFFPSSIGPWLSAGKLNVQPVMAPMAILSPLTSKPFSCASRKG